MDEKRKVALYCRVAHNDELAAECQLERLKAYTSGKEIARVYEDRCSVAQFRPGLRQLLDDAHNHAFDTLIAVSASRLDRDVDRLLQIVTELEENGVNVLFVDGFEKALPTLKTVRGAIHA